MVHLFVASGAVEDGRTVIRGDDAQHLARALRAGPGMPVTLADGSGAIYRGRVTSVRRGGDGVGVEVTGRTAVPVPRPRVRVVHALPKGRKLDEVVQRLTELGVDRISPVHSLRSQVRLDAEKARKAHRRWSAIAHAAAKQSTRARLPVVDDVGDWSAHRWSEPGIVLWEEASTPMRDVIADVAAGTETLTVAVGPEGGLTADEIGTCGLRPVSLGPTVLRTEFASVAGVVAALTLLGRFG